jgi:hypothetical protein
VASSSSSSSFAIPSFAILVALLIVLDREMAMVVGVGTPPTIAPLQAVTSSTQRACAIRPSSSNTLSSLVYSEELCVRRRNARTTWSPLKVRSIAAGPPKSPGTTGAAASQSVSQQQQKQNCFFPHCRLCMETLCKELIY